MHKSNVEDFLLLCIKAGADRSGRRGKAERSFKVQYLVSIKEPIGKNACKLESEKWIVAASV